MKVIESRSRLQEQKSAKSHPATPSVTEMGQSRYICNDGKSISVIDDATCVLPRAAPRGRRPAHVACPSDLQ